MRVGVLGAGAIGGWLGGALHLRGVDTLWIVRPWLQEALAANGLVHTSLAGHSQAGEAPPMATDPSALADCDVVLVAVKGKDTTRAAEEAAPHLKPGTLVVSCQNGLDNGKRLAAALPDQRVAKGMVSFNVVKPSDHEWRQTTSGPVVIEAMPETRLLIEWLNKAGVHTLGHEQMDHVSATKLLYNLNNAINALSGIPLREQLLDPGYRRLLAAAINEGRAVFTAAGTPPIRVDRMIPWLTPLALRLPTPLFRLAAAPLLKIDPQARSSMYEDLSRNKPTEIDDLNGAVVRLGREHGVPTPVNQLLVDQVEQAEAAKAGSPQLAAEVLWASLS